MSFLKQQIITKGAVTKISTLKLVYQPDGLGCTTQGGKTIPILLDCILNIKKQNV